MSRKIKQVVTMRVSCDYSDCGAMTTVTAESIYKAEDLLEKRNWVLVSSGPGDRTEEHCPVHYVRCPTCKGVPPPKLDDSDDDEHCESCSPPRPDNSCPTCHGSRGYRISKDRLKRMQDAGEV